MNDFPRTLCSILALLAMSLSQTALGQTTFHGDLARNGVYRSSGPTSTGSVKWSFKTGGPIFASPAISDGVVYIGSGDGVLYAVDETTGTQKWKTATRGQIASSPTVADGMVFFGSYDGGFYALDAATGKRVWRYATGFERRFEGKGLHGFPLPEQTIPDAHDVFLSSPAVYHGRVYFGSSDGNLYAVDEKTGMLQWKFETGGLIHASPTIANNLVYIGSWDSYLYALDADTGAEKWRFKTGEDPIIHNQVGFQSSAAFEGGVIYTGCRDAHVYAIDALTGRKKWDYPTAKSWVNTTPAVYDGTVYASTGDTHKFMALDAKNGNLKFFVDVGTVIFSSPAIAGGMAYFGNLDGKLFAIDLKTGQIAWAFRTEASKKDVLQFLKPDGTRKSQSEMNVQEFHDFEDMYLYWYLNVSIGAIVSSPVVDNGVIFFGSTDGNLYALQ